MPLMTTRSWGPIVVLLACLAVSWEQPAHAQAGRAFVLVRRDALLHARPDPQSERVRDPWSRRFAARIGPFWVMQRVGEQGDWVEVATVPGFVAGQHCYDTIGALDALELRFFVRRDAIAPVIARRVERTFDDGTRITLVPGVGLVRRGAEYEAQLRGATVRVRLAPEDVSQSYTGSAHIAISRGSNAMLEPGAQIELGDDHRVETEEAGPRAQRSSRVSFSVREAGDARAPAGEPPRAALAVEAPPDAGNRPRVTVRGDCFEALGFVRRAQLTMERPHRSVSQLRERRGTAIRPGAQISWPDGSPAGRATNDAVVEGSMRQDGARMCFDHPLRPPSGRLRPDDTISLCVPRDAITQRGRR
jgi:hypothetical protein